MNWYLTVLKKYAVFSGRASRKEYWMFFLFNLIFVVVAMILDNVLHTTFGDLGYGFFYMIYILVVMIPGLAVSIRRLHDVGKSGWFILISLIPFIGLIWLLVLMCLEGTIGNNKYGPDPIVRPDMQTYPIQTAQMMQQNIIPETESIKCSGCGAINLKQKGKNSNCEYCDLPL